MLMLTYTTTVMKQKSTKNNTGVTAETFKEVYVVRPSSKFKLIAMKKLHRKSPNAEAINSVTFY